MTFLILPLSVALALTLLLLPHFSTSSASSRPHHIPGSVTSPTSPIQFSLYPPCTTPDRPLQTTRFVELQILPFWPEGETYTVNVSGISTVLESRNPYFEITKYTRYNDPRWWGGDSDPSEEKPVLVEVLGRSSFDTKSDSGSAVIVQSSPVHIYWDFRYVAVVFGVIEEKRIFLDGNNAGRIQLRAVPDPGSMVAGTGIENATRLMYWIPRIYPEKSLASIGSQSQSEIEFLHWIVPKCPSIRYFQLKGQTGYSGDRTPASGFSSLSRNLAIRCCDAVGSTGCPALDGTFAGTLFDVSDVPGNAQMPIVKYDIVAFEGTLLRLPLGGNCPSEIEAIVPFNVSIDPLWTRANRPYDIVYEKINSTHVVMKLVLVESRWSYKNVYLSVSFDFASWMRQHPGPSVGEGQVFDMWLRLGPEVAAGTTLGPWQIVKIHPKTLQKNRRIVSRNRNTRFMNSATWGSITSYESFELYADLGFNQVPRTQVVGYTYSFDDDGRLGGVYTLASRTGPDSEWVRNGLTFCPEISLLHSRNTAFKVKSVYSDILEVHEWDPAYFPETMSGAERDLERQKWINAILFYNETGHPDLGYDGYFLDITIDLLQDVVDFALPECVNFDIEGWSSQSNYVADAQLSQNLQDRKLSPTESDLDVVKRVASELLHRIANAVHHTKPDIKMVWYATRSGGNYVYQTASYDMYDSAGFIPQPSLYFPQKNVDVIADMIRSSRTYLQPPTITREMIPMPAPNTYGEFKVSETLDLCFHLFGNGATGIQYYGMSQVDDFEMFLHLQECFGIFYAHEDLIMDGEVGYSDFSHVGDDLVLGAMKMSSASGSEFVISITRKKKPFQDIVGIEGDFSFRLRYPHSYFILTNERTEEDWTDRATFVSDNGGEIAFRLAENELPTVLHVVSVRSRFTWSLLSGVLGGLLAVFGLCVAIILVILLAYVAGRNKKDENGEVLGKRDDSPSHVRDGPDVDEKPM